MPPRNLPWLRPQPKWSASPFLLSYQWLPGCTCSSASGPFSVHSQLDAKQGPVGLLHMEAILCPISYRQASSLHDLLWVPQGKTTANQRRSSQWTTWGKIKGPERLIKIRRLGHLRPCTDRNLFSNPTLLKLCRRKNRLLLPDHLICLLRNLYAGQEATVRTGHGTTNWFQIGKGVRQGCI